MRLNSLGSSSRIDQVGGKPALDVMTTAIPRLLTVQSISEFLGAIEDREQFHLRWLFHLDWYPGLEHNWRDNVKQALFMAEQFDDAVLIFSKSNVSFEGSVWRLITQVERDLLWIEDDHTWTCQFRLADIIRAIRRQRADGFNFGRQRPKFFGATIPTYWTYGAVKYLVDHWPQRRRFIEIVLKTCVFIRKGFHYARVEGLPPKNISREIGRLWMFERGFTVNHEGLPTDPELRNSHLRTKKGLEGFKTKKRSRHDKPWCNRTVISGIGQTQSVDQPHS